MANKITVTSLGTTANVNATPDSARYYSDKSKEWAISDKLIDNTDYSSKYYANESKKQADISTAKTTEVIESGNTAVTNIESARDNAIIDITNQENLSVDNVNTAGATQISSVNTAGITQVANVNSAGTTQINLAKEQVTLATNQANIATEQATIATNKASEVVASGNEALSNIDTAKTGAITDITDLKNDSISSIDTAKSEALTEVETLHSSSVTDITDLKNTSVSNITTAKNNAITSITTQETTSKNNVIATGNEQVERVNLTGVDNRTPIFSKNEIGTNEGVYKNVYDLKHSTFDKSKFTVVGSPTITDDGIVSGFSGANDISVGFPSISGNELIIEGVYNWNGLYPTSSSGVVHLLGDNKLTLFQAQDGKLELYRIISNQPYYDFGRFNILANTPLKYIITLTLTSLNITCYQENTEIYNKTVTTNLPNISDFKSLKLSPFAEQTQGSIDLKQFSITVDGKEVFSGNKTGLDVIKPDNYEVVGSPVISDDGVASGFSNENYLKQLQVLDFSKEIKFHFNCVYKSYTRWQRLVTLGIGYIVLNLSKQIVIQPLNTTDGRIVSKVLPINEGDNIEFEITISNAIRKLKFKNITTGITVSDENTTAITIETINQFAIPVNGNNLDVWAGSIDLNSFKIYVDGNLVYQPCLKIPYTQSKTGSKIVDVAYRDRVIDIYEQEGQAGYYTIDEPNKNFTLPMGEIYGMIGQRSLISSTVTETNRVDIYSDKTCLICGNVATAGTINLPIELVNKNYFVTLPTSAKTATSFTTTSTGDYILIGKVA